MKSAVGKCMQQEFLKSEKGFKTIFGPRARDLFCKSPNSDEMVSIYLCLSYNKINLFLRLSGHLYVHCTLNNTVER